MYIAPNGNIWLMTDVPLDNTYQHTFYWPITQAGKEQQKALLASASSPYAKRWFNQQSYTRLNKGSIRVNVVADDIYECNYMAYQNTGFGNKTFYAFITSIEYINNVVSEIHFEIDVIQTWYFDYNLQSCFVERTHTRTDNIGDNIVPEALNIGEYVYSGIYKETVTSDLCLIMAIVDVSVTETASGNRYGNIYGGATLWCFKSTAVTAINTKISEYVGAGKPDAIVSLYMCPSVLIRGEIPDEGFQLEETDVRTGINELITAVPTSILDVDDDNTFGNYTPHNNKLFTYPFTYFEVFTAQGKSAKYRYEFFSNNTPQFDLGGSITQPVELVLIPANYKSTSNVEWLDGNLLNESISIDDYPICSWNTDAYAAWIAQNAVPIGRIQLAEMGARVALSFINPLAGAISAASIISTASNTLQQGYRASIEADKLHGQSKGSANISMNAQGFFFAKVILNETDARCIDSFFDEFGYAVKRIQEPRRKNRKYFTYVKTVGCSISVNSALGGGIPADDANKICKLHDNGITYWDASETRLIGNYNLAATNTPIGY